MRREKGSHYYKKLIWVIIVPCTGKKTLLRTHSQKGIGEMLNTKLATIIEEPEGLYDRVNQIRYNDSSKIKINDNNSKLLSFKGKKGKELIRSRLFKKSRLLVSNDLSIKGSYINFLGGFVAKGSLTGVPRY
ncbi:hypothetical protein RND81_13G174300 [Saponaria officinalis]|uniref:Uncharacterized protein n=1 Tax=Saponaria officinalis TaxID=3572 RepID=A0AAW1H4S4_SAPOF